MELFKKRKITNGDISQLLDELYSKINTGIPKVSQSVSEMANDYLAKDEDNKKAVKKMLNNQIMKCTTSGFLTGFGGFLTLPVTIPANVSSVLYVQMRMITCTAYMAGYDINSDQVQTFVYACLAGVSLAEIIKQTVKIFGEKLFIASVKKIPGKVLTKINQKVGFRLLTKFGSKGIINIGKLVPIVGAIVGGTFDFADTKILANRAYQWFFENNFSCEEEKCEESDNIVIVEDDFKTEEV